MIADLPSFRFHPDPFGTGVFVERAVHCLSCEHERPVTYVGPVYCVEELHDRLCPWCIADGSAARTFDAEFTDAGWGADSGVTADGADEVLHRTPGYIGWQQEVWLSHCRTPAVFLGPVGADEIAAHPDAAATIRAEFDGLGWTDEGLDEYLGMLTRDGSPSAYLFRCLVCGAHLARSDFH